MTGVTMRTYYFNYVKERTVGPGARASVEQQVPDESHRHEGGEEEEIKKKKKKKK